MRTRQEHLAWCKERALEYVDAGDPTNAVQSMMSDLNKHEETKGAWHLMMIGMLDASKGDTEGLRRWIEGFN